MSHKPDSAEYDLGTAWDVSSAEFQERRGRATDSAHYGPFAPTENELRLLGDVSGQRILELGCGGGQCAIAFAKQGATVAGVDLSPVQLDFARELAQEQGVSVAFHLGDVADLSAFGDSSWDVVTSVYAFHYLEEMAPCLAECHRVLVPGGRLVFCLDHPMRDCFWDETDGDMAVYPVRSYFDERPMDWHMRGPEQIWMRTYHRTIAQWIDLLHAAGLRLIRLVEPVPPQDLADEPWASEFDIQVGTQIPQAIIFVAEADKSLSKRIVS